MASLVEDILSIEKQADQIVADSRAEAVAIEKRAEAEIESIRRNLATETDARIEAYRREAEARCAQDAITIDREARAMLAAVDGIADNLIGKQAERIVARFRGL